MNEYVAVFAAAFAGAVIGACVVRGSGGAEMSRISYKLSRIAEGMGISLAPDLPSEVSELARSGRKIDAIKQLRELKPGLGLKEAKDLVEMVE